VQTASQCAAYDAAKRVWRKLTGAGDGVATHLAASAATGLVTTTCTAPIDVVKTRMMVSSSAASGGQQQGSPRGGGGGGEGGGGVGGGGGAGTAAAAATTTTATAAASPSPWSVARDLVRAEGPAALLKGWSAQYVRLGPQTVITFLVLERLRGLCDLPPL
jgi:solute carrier family 25 uncoupling protein 8/9